MPDNDRISAVAIPFRPLPTVLPIGLGALQLTAPIIGGGETKSRNLETTGEQKRTKVCSARS